MLLIKKSKCNFEKRITCNILFKNAIIKAHQIQFNESLDIYADTSFVLEYLKYAERFVRITNFPFYYRGEVYDPFYGNTLSDQDFTNKFEDHVNSFFDAMQRTNDKRIKISSFNE